MLPLNMYAPRERLCHDDPFRHQCTGLTQQRSCAQVVNIPNSMTVLPELLPYSVEMVRRLFRALLQHRRAAAHRQ